MTDNAKPFRKIIAKCWADETFRQQLLADPAATLKAEGVPVPDGVSVTVLEDSASTRHLVLPAAPAHLSADQLDAIAAGSESQGQYIPGGISWW